jgi:hypothetical protein
MVRGEFSRPYFTLTLPPRLRLSRLVPREAAMIGAKSPLHFIDPETGGRERSEPKPSAGRAWLVELIG